MTDNWKNSAACASIGGDIWFPPKGVVPHKAIAICDACPVKAMCLTAGMDEEHGIWGGLTPAQRAKLRPPTEPVEPTRPRHVDTQFIIDAHKRGMPANDIAEHAGCTQRTVHRVLKAEREKAA